MNNASYSSNCPFPTRHITCPHLSPLTMRITPLRLAIHSFFSFHSTCGFNEKINEQVSPIHTHSVWIGEYFPLSLCIMTAGSPPHHQNAMTRVAGYSRRHWSIGNNPTGVYNQSSHTWMEIQLVPADPRMTALKLLIGFRWWCNLITFRASWGSMY